MSAKKSVIIDCDPGVDDAIALFLAFASPELDLLAVTTVAGNIGAHLTARNACIVRQLAGRPDVPVYAGCTRPMIRLPVEASMFHGASGLGPLALFEPDAPLAPGHSVDAIIDLVLSHPPRSVTVVVTGPMTNLAMAIIREPLLVERVGLVVAMGGARTEGGNITPSSEFNIHADPHAAHVVFTSGVETVVFGLDVTHQVRATPPRTAAIHAVRSVTAKATAELLDFANPIEMTMHGGEGTPMHDPCTIAWLLKPELFELRPCLLNIEINSPLTLGHTSVDFHVPPSGAATCRWATKANADGFFQLLTERLTP